MSTILETPQGIVEVGDNFNGNVAPSFDAKIENTVMFEGNAKMSTPTPAANIFTTKQEAD